MTLQAIGSITIRLRKPSFSWVSSTEAKGQRTARISGVVQWSQAQQLSELMANPALHRTIGGSTGVLEYLEFDDELLGPFTGWYLLGPFTLEAAWEWSGHGLNHPVAFSLDATFLGAAA